MTNDRILSRKIKVQLDIYSKRITKIHLIRILFVLSITNIKIPDLK
jgi:hypothetical protein